MGGIETVFKKDVPASELTKTCRQVREEGLGKPNFHRQGQGGW
jgi:hypothetical protein